MTDFTAYLPSANKAIRDGSPDRLNVVATLFGLAAVPLETSRVLGDYFTTVSVSIAIDFTPPARARSIVSTTLA
jgi:hypothetical protein